ncbi:MAG: hypothetical protein V4592_05640 [Bacteroidota bacterium]
MSQSKQTTPEDIQQQTEQLKTNIAELNNVLVQLAKNQESLGETIKEGGKNFKEIGKAAKDAAESLKKLNEQLTDSTKTIGASKKTIDENKKALTELQEVHETLTKSHRVSSKQLNKLSDDIQILTKNITDQEKALAQSKETFDYHKAIIEQINSATEKLKKSNKDFGPVLEDVTKGFNMMKDGLAVVKTGFTGVGAAIKATGFGLLVLVLQSVVEYFTKTTEGAKKLKGGIAAISLVIKTVKDTVSHILGSIGKNIADAVSNPAETVKKVWNAVIENITNRFKGIQVFFKGLFSGDLKAMGDGVIQMGTGVTHGTTKLKQSFNQFKTDISQAGKIIADTYKKAAEGSDDTTKKIAANHNEIHKKLSVNKSSEDVKSKKDKTYLSEARSIGVVINQSSSDESSFSQHHDTAINNHANPEVKKITKDISTEDGIIKSHISGDWKVELDLRQQQLNKEKAQAIKFAQEKNESVLKVDQDYKEKQKQLDKAKLDAQFANQQNYLKSVDKLSGALSGIFGKNTIAAKAAFKAHQAAAAGQVIIDTEKSIMGIWSANASIPFIGVPKAIAETAIAVAAGASSLAGIVKQKPGFAKGGYYASDGRGALLPGYSRSDDTNAYLRSGEAVVVSEAMRNPWARNLVSAINVAHGGRDFATANPGKGYAIGGIFTDGGNANRYYSQPANDVKDLANTLAYQMINNFPPIYVDVKDVNNQQNILAQTVNRVNL